MKFIRRSLSALLLLALLAAGWLWWHRPKRVDMAAYAPADSLIYLEANSLARVANSVTSTDAWRALEPHLRTDSAPWRNHWLQKLASWVGIGSAEAVIFARAQMAFVILDLKTTHDGETLNVKPEVALIVETHAPERQVIPVIERVVGHFAQRAYGQPLVERTVTDRAQMMKWMSPGSDRQIVAAIDGSVAIVGNDERAVRICLAVRRGLRPSLINNRELEQMRTRLSDSSALAFGYVSAENAAQLLSIATPLALGRLPDDLQLQRLIAPAASKILGSAGWSAHPSAGGIEDHYLFSLHPSIVARLRSGFRPSGRNELPAELLPAETFSATTYDYEDPAAAWASLNSALSSQLDTLSAGLVTYLLKSALEPYGIDQPEIFLRAVASELATVRVDKESDRSLLIVRVLNDAVLREFVRRRLGTIRRVERVGNEEVIESASGNTAASFVGGYLMIGSPADVRRCLQARTARATVDMGGRIRPITYFASPSAAPNVMTYTDDSERVRTFVSTIVAAQRTDHTLNDTAGLDRAIRALPYSITETTLDEWGLERRTRSSFGQFSSLVGLFAANTIK